MTFIYVCVLILTVVLVVWLMTMAVDHWYQPLGKVFAGAFLLLIALLITAMVEYERQNPCVKYEVETRYDAATKTVRPMKVCVERGEWVEK
jgi:glucan phosphoethanolaminetransferase (alkaline phosphatase superfamily)